MVSKGPIVGIDWNPIARLHSHVLTFFSESSFLPNSHLISCCCCFSVKYSHLGGRYALM